MAQGRGQRGAGSAEADASSGLRIIKKYPNRRLYDTRTSAYITLAEVKEMVMRQEDFEVRDAKSQEDITRSILLQIILEEEGGGVPMFSTPMLAHMIRVYGQAMQGLMGVYLEKNVQAFMDMQSTLAQQSMKPFGGMPGAASGTDAWTQMLNAQNPAMQGLMNAYLEQSQQALSRLQEQMQSQTDQMLGAFGVKRPPPDER